MNLTANNMHEKGYNWAFKDTATRWKLPESRVDTILKIKETLESKLEVLGWHFTDSGGIDKLDT